MSRELRVKCLVLDHDDTAVRSTLKIHYPSFCKSLAELRPDMDLQYQQFVEWNFEPGFSAMCYDILGYSKEEMAVQEKYWLEGMKGTIAPMYEGLSELLIRYVENGGKLCVSSHSSMEYIVRDYKAAGAPIPEHIYDWSCERKKPDPFALEEVMRIYGLKPEEVLMVDDLKPGVDMAKKAGVPVAGAGWSENHIPKIRKVMQENCDYYLERVSDLENLLYKE